MLKRKRFAEEHDALWMEECPVCYEKLGTTTCMGLFDGYARPEGTPIPKTNPPVFVCGNGHAMHEHCCQASKQSGAGQYKTNCVVCKAPLLKPLLEIQRAVYDDGEHRTDKTKALRKAKSSWDTVSEYHGEPGYEHLVSAKGRSRDGVEVQNKYEGPAGNERLVERLQSSGNKIYFEGPHKEERMIRSYNEDTKLTIEFKGKKDAEYMVRKVLGNGTIVLYEGKKGEERVVTQEFKNVPADELRVEHYEGAKGEERCVKIVYADGKSFTTMAGTRGNEYMVSSFLPGNFITKFYCCGRGNEHVVRSEVKGDPKVSDRTRYYNGPKGCEHKVMVEIYGEGERKRTQHYEGPKDKERMVMSVDATGSRSFEGEKEEERVVMFRFHDTGDIMHYEGDKGQERIVRGEKKDGSMFFMEGPKDKERVIKHAHKSGRMDFFEGPQKEEKLVRIEDKGWTYTCEGERPHERVVYGESQQEDGLHKQWFAGLKGKEAIRKHKDPQGNIRYYRGVKNKEVHTRTQWKDGSMTRYFGQKGSERKVLHRDKDGVCTHYRGLKGEEVEVRVNDDQAVIEVDESSGSE